MDGFEAANTTNGALSSGVMNLSCTNTAVRFDVSDNSYVLLYAPLKGDGHWVWVFTAAKVTVTGSTELILALECDSTHPMEFYAPVLLRVGAGVFSDSEAREFGQHLQSYPDGAPVGHVSTLRSQKLITHGGLGVGNSATVTGSMPTPTRKMEVFDAAGASLGYVPIYPTIT